MKSKPKGSNELPGPGGLDGGPPAGGPDVGAPDDGGTDPGVYCLGAAAAKEVMRKIKNDKIIQNNKPTLPFQSNLKKDLHTHWGSDRSLQQYRKKMREVAGHSGYENMQQQRKLSLLNFSIVYKISKQELKFWNYTLMCVWVWE